NRFLYSAHPNVLSEEQLANYKLAKSCFSILDPTYSFAHVNPSTNEIMLNSPSGLIYLEYLSSGYKACLSILLGVIKEIEYRFQETKLRAAQFDGILLIDELSLHLHPNWQAQIKDLILNTFPNIQLIATTHSPHVIQRLSPNEIIALSRTENGVVKRELPSSEYGYQGWTLEEVLEDVMGMSSTTTQLLDSMFSRFEESIEQEDYQQASLAFKELDKLLHPNNHLRKLLRLQLASIAEDND
ncbi:MAG: AAA family ATPase, partial [Candidatus Promineifilaceae bacterium]